MAPVKPATPTTELPNTGMTSTLGIGVSFLVAGILVTLSKKKDNE